VEQRRASDATCGCGAAPQGRHDAAYGKIRALRPPADQGSHDQLPDNPDARPRCQWREQGRPALTMADEFGHLPRRPSRIIKATIWSLQGLRAAWLYESSFRLEVYLFVLLAPLGWWLGESGVERALLVGSLLLVLSIELLNSAVEAVIERFGDEFHELAGRAKDMGSAAVFVLMLNVLLVWGAILGPRWIG
jgi:diacylglycerol kinase (ATP)